MVWWYPFTQHNPLFTEELGSPFTATALLFSMPINTPQPTPQNLHGALFHVRSPSDSALLICSSAKTIPGKNDAAAVMAEAAAIFFKNALLLVTFLIII